MYCPYCGVEYDDAFKFCPKCGKQKPDQSYCGRAGSHSQTSEKGVCEIGFFIRFPFIHLVFIAIFSLFMSWIMDTAYNQHLIELKFRGMGYSLSQSQDLTKYTTRLTNSDIAISINFPITLVYCILCSYNYTTFWGRLGICAGGAILSFILYIIPRVILWDSPAFVAFIFYLILFTVGYQFYKRSRSTD